MGSRKVSFDNWLLIREFSSWIAVYRKCLVGFIPILLASSAIAHEPQAKFPWSHQNKCIFGNYSPTGLFPSMKQALVDLDLSHRITRGYDPRNAIWNYHYDDYTFSGVKYTAAVDLSIRCMTDDQIKDLLGELVSRGFASWLRRNNEDGWSGSDHIHAVWVSAKLKKELRDQVKDWLMRKNGLSSKKIYKFWRSNEQQRLAVKIAFDQANM